MRTRPIFWALAVFVFAALLLPAGGFAKKPKKPEPATNTTNAAEDVQDVTPYLNKAQLPVLTGSEVTPFGRLTVPGGGAASRAGRSAFSHTPVVGELRNWLGLDFENGFFYRKQYQLRGIGEHIEVWVAEGLQGPTGFPPSNDLDFLPGDCRNGERTIVTDEQVQYLVSEFDNNIFPKESAAFSIPPNRSGTSAVLGPPNYHPTGDGDNIVVLIDNVRDENFYDFNNTQGFSYVAGFFSSQLNGLFDRNIMTIDGFDWLHRTGAEPPHEPIPGDNCNSAPARPFLYEGVFAHEYQHLLESYEDPDEVNWVNEGLSDWAQTLTGYVDPATPITEIGFDSHVQCFLGWLGVQTEANPNPRPGGPENSLTIWGDQGDGEILCDYGAAYTIMEFLAGRYGQDFMSALHREDANGFAGLQAVLNQFGAQTAVLDVLHDWAAMVALDAFIDDGGKIRGRADEDDFQTPTLNASINWDTPHAYSTPGAPPNGSDYVRLRDSSGNYLRARDVDSISFNGSSTLPSLPVEWTVDANPPMHAGDPALYSGTANNLDRAIVRSVMVPAGSPTLTFESLWNLELGWDFGFVQVSTNGGATYQSISCTDTTSAHDPGAIPPIVANLPGFTGYPGGWRNETCSLSAYAGQTILLSFRLMTDPAVQGDSPAVPPGWWVDDVAVGGTLISDGSTLAGWQSPTQIRPVPVSGFTVQLIGYGGNGPGVIGTLELNSNFDSTLTGGQLRRIIGNQAEVVAAIITYDEPTETIMQYACYTLTVNGVTQPGGC
jgi:hypothetical protein